MNNDFFIITSEEQGDKTNLRFYEKSDYKNIFIGMVMPIFILLGANSVSLESQTSIDENNFYFSDNSIKSNNFSANFSYYFDSLPFFSGEKEENKQQIKDISSLEDNWNGYGAKQFSNTIISSAEKIIDILTWQPEVFPTGRESIQFEYEKDNGDYLELELFENGKIKLFILYSDGRKEKKYVTLNEVKSVVDNFYGSQILRI